MDTTGRTRYADRTGGPQPAWLGADPAGGPRPSWPGADVIGGRWLAWIGAVATLLGIVLLLALAISHGWIGHEGRVLLGALGSAGLVGGGTWLGERRGRTEAALGMVGAGTGGLFVVLVVASGVYGLISPYLAVAGAVLVAGLAAGLAMRWGSATIATIGMFGGLVAPALMAVPQSGVRIAIMAVVTAAALAVIVRRRWGWLGIPALLLSEPQAAAWALSDRRGVAGVLVLGGFAVLGLVAAAGLQAGSRRDGIEPAAAAMLALSAVILAPVGRFPLLADAGPAAVTAWLAGLAAAHAALALWAPRRGAALQSLRATAAALAVILADAAFGLSTHGLALGLGWGAAAIAFAWLARHTKREGIDRFLVGLGLGAHVGLVLLRAVVMVPPRALGSGNFSLVSLVAVGTLTVCCCASARLFPADERQLPGALNILGLTALAYLTALTFAGAGLVPVWGAEAVALAVLARTDQDRVAGFAAYAFLAGAALCALLVDAPPWALLTGAPDLSDAMLALGAIASALLGVARQRPTGDRVRWMLCAATAVVPLYLASIVIITTFQPAVNAGIDLLDLSVRQQGQVLLSGLWSITGLVTLIVGLRRNLAVLRNAALGLLLVSAAKVFLYDLSTLTSVYRVTSVIVLGLLLLAGAFVYQRLRPPPPPDFRTVSPGER